MPTFGQGLIAFNDTWTQVKATVISKSLGLQYEDEGPYYSIFAVDNPIVYATTIFKGTLPDAVSASYSQVQNDADKADFLNNWLNVTNQRLTTPISGTLSVSAVGTLPVNINNWPAVHGVSGSVNAYTSGLQGVSGTVQVWSEGPLPVSGTVFVTQTGSLHVTVDNSELAVSNFPATQNVSGTVFATQTGSFHVTVDNSELSIANFPSIQNVSGAVALVNWPATMGVSASATLPAALTNWPAIMGVSGTVTVNALTSSTFRVVPDPYKQIILSNQTVTSSGTGSIIVGEGYSEVYLIVNILSASGGNSSINFSIFEVDPIDQATPIPGQSGSTGALTTVGLSAPQLADLNGDTIKVTWQVAGTSPSFKVNATVFGHVAGNAIEGQADIGQPLHDGPVAVAGADVNTLVRVILTDTLGRIITAPASAAASNGEAFGNVALSGISNGNFVSKTTYTEQTGSAVVRAVVSTSTSDAAAGTGAQKVTITYYDQNYNGPFTETVTLNGTTQVATVSTTMCFIEKMVVAAVGSGGVSVGTISLLIGHYTGATAFWSIAAGDNQTFTAHHYTPVGKTTNVTGMGAGINGGAGSFYLRCKASGSTSPEIQVTELLRESAQAATTQRQYSTPVQCVGPGRIRCYVNTEANTALDYRGSFDFYDQ